MAEEIKQEPQLIKKSNWEYELVEGGDVWIDRKGLQIKIIDTGEGIVVDIWPKCENAESSISGAWASFEEGEYEGDE